MRLFHWSLYLFLFMLLHHGITDLTLTKIPLPYEQPVHRSR